MLILSGSLNTQNALKIYDGNNITLDISKYQKINLNSNNANITLPIINGIAYVDDVFPNSSSKCSITYCKPIKPACTKSSLSYLDT